jgi:hypothetical protein
MQTIENIFHKNTMLRETQDNRFTVAFDMDNTLFNEKGSKKRPGIENALELLKSKNIKMVVWTNATKGWAEDNFKNLGLSNYFHGLITRESYVLNEIKKHNPDFHKKIIQAFPREAAFQEQYDTGKNISLLGYDVLVDDNPRIKAEAAFWGNAYEVRVCESFRSTGGLRDAAQMERIAKEIVKLARPGLFSRLFSRGGQR